MRIVLSVFFACVFCVVSIPAHASMLDIKEVKTESGITAWLVEDHSVPVIAMDFAFRGAGAAIDPKNKQGLARMLSNTMDEGAGSLNAQEFQKELQDLVTALRFSASRDHMNGSLKTLTKNRERSFELLKLALTKPRFDNEAIERMRNANQSRIRSSLSDPGWNAARILNDKAFADHPYAKNSGGTLSSLDNIKASDLKAFHGKALGKNNLVISVAGDITADKLGALIDDVFGDLPEVDVPEIENLELQNTGGIFLHKKDIPQTIIEMMHPGIAQTDPKFQIAQIMNYILGSSGFGSRLTSEIREKRGLTYGVYSYFYNLDHFKGLAVSTSTENKNVPEMLDLIAAEFEKLKSEHVSDQELSDAQSYLIGSLPLSLTSTDKIAGLLNNLQLEGLPIDYLDRRKAAIEATNKDDIKALANELLDSENFVTILVGQPLGIDKDDLTSVPTLPNVE